MTDAHQVCPLYFGTGCSLSAPCLPAPTRARRALTTYTTSIATTVHAAAVDVNGIVGIVDMPSYYASVVVSTLPDLPPEPSLQRQGVVPNDLSGSSIYDSSLASSGGAPSLSSAPSSGPTSAPTSPASGARPSDLAIFGSTSGAAAMRGGAGVGVLFWAVLLLC
jgi:hypothetical protein